MFEAGMEEVRKSWMWFLVAGIVLMLLGATCIVKSQTATTFSILALGWVLAISGVVWLVGAFQTWTWGGFFVYLLNAIIRGVTGYLLIRHPDAGAEGVTMVLAALFIVGGLFRAVAAGKIQFPRWGWTVFAGLVSVALGVYLLATWKATSTFFIGLVMVSTSSLMVLRWQGSRVPFTAYPRCKAGLPERVADCWSDFRGTCGT
jgi:uncharacterized membrane protein HdeD (DUF308 family)